MISSFLTSEVRRIVWWSEEKVTNSSSWKVYLWVIEMVTEEELSMLSLNSSSAEYGR